MQSEPVAMHLQSATGGDTCHLMRPCPPCQASIWYTAHLCGPVCQWTAIQYSMFTINSHAHGHVNEISPCGCTIFSFISKMFINNYFFIMFNLTPRVNDVVVALLSQGCICYSTWGAASKVRTRHVVMVVIKMHSQTSQILSLAPGWGFIWHCNRSLCFNRTLKSRANRKNSKQPVLAS